MRPAFIAGAVVPLLLLVLGACSIRSTVVGPGEQAVLVRQPMFFTAFGGVDSTPITTGRKWHANSTHGVISLK